MQPSLDKLHKFFKLESERGYDNKAVVGGLDKILTAWEAEARADKLPENTVQLVSKTLRDYPNLESAQRADTLRDLWRTIQPGNRGERRPGNFPQRQKPPQQPQKQLDPPPPPAVNKIEGLALKTKEPEVEQRPPFHTPSRNLKKAIETDENSTFGVNAPLTVIPGIGPKTAATLSTIGLYTLGDLLYYFPRRYDDYSQLKPILRLWYGEEVTVIGTVQSINVRPVRGGPATIIEAVISDGSGALRLTWFNQPWIANRLRPGVAISVSGKIDQYLGRLTMSSPEWEPLGEEQIHTNRIVPVYPLTSRITQKWLRKTIKQAVDYWAPRQEDYLPESIRKNARLVDLPTALYQTHNPDTMEALKAARERLAFDEILFLQLGVLSQKRNWREATGRVFETPGEWLQGLIDRLPFTLTQAQQKALDDLCSDLVSGHPMDRLLQGDVGSGKTVIAALGIAIVARHGAQAAMMAPTSILAEQHFRSLKRLLCGSEEQTEGCVIGEDQIRLLIGDTPEQEKEAIRQALADGSLKVVVGTHALIEDPIVFHDLQMVVVDEQHRFGVEQRSALRLKGENPHLLVMTATPIPRSLALTVYGDLDLSVMDELPAGRQVIDTHVLFPRERERAYTLIRSQVGQGHQAFIIYPLVEQNGKDEAKAAVEEHARLQNEVFPRLKLGLLHGRMRPDEKEEVMARFRDNEYNILVSTSVVEVGVDIPNATVMLIEGANRFGLAQLHQFRGRVGRGAAKSFCLLIPENEDSGENDRLTAMVETNDGFVLAERDLQQRGPGEFLGKRQSGYSALHMANLTDIRLIEKARSEAISLFSDDPDLAKPEVTLLAKTLRRFWGEGKGDIS